MAKPQLSGTGENNLLNLVRAATNGMDEIGVSKTHQNGQLVQHRPSLQQFRMNTRLGQLRRNGYRVIGDRFCSGEFGASDKERRLQRSYPKHLAHFGLTDLVLHRPSVKSREQGLGST
ncbi:hypothetical protein [Hydrogenophaga sp.]|uniref:hypothetical protein n=1 Tax=Hydrogenophaga sp. TaxID=1904254 RepID=UPI003AF8C939